MNLSAVIAHHADRHPEQLALSIDAREMTYAELFERIRRTAGALADAGAGRGDVIGVLLHNGIELLEVMGAAAHLGAVFMPLNWRLAPAELAYVCDHAGARVLVSEPELAGQLDELARSAGVAGWLGVGENGGRWRPLEDATAAARPRDAVEVAGDDVMRLMYTSGTTSRPKGVMITFANLYWKCIGQTIELGLTRADRGLACGPLYHVGALDLVTTNMLYVGAETRILRRFDARAVAEVIEQRRITNVWLAPAMVNLIVSSGATEGRDMTSLRLLVDGGEKMPLQLIQKVLEIFPSAWFADAYGLTETVSGDTCLDKGATVSKLGSVGKPILHTEVRIVDPADRPVGAGEIGEIVLRGPKVCKGYWRDPEATARAMRGGWFHTGDLGYLDEDGFLFVVDRLKDVIVSGGENVASLEVERVVYEHPDVLEAAVVSRPDERWGEVPVAYVVLRDGATAGEAALDAFCRERLAGFKTPKGFRFLDALPRNPSGKVLKRELREREHGATTRA